MAPQPDVIKPHDDPFGLLQQNWPSESESSYRAAEVSADEAATVATIQAQSALDADFKMTDEKGKLADSIRSGYSSAATKLQDKGRELTSVSGWLADAAGVIGGAKKHMALLVRTGTSEIRDALDSEVKGESVSPSSRELTDKYRNDINSVATKLTIDLDAIGHSMTGDTGSSTIPTYVHAEPTPIAPTIQQVVRHSITGEGPHVEPVQLPEMPRVPTAEHAESPSTPSTPDTPAPASPHAVNPTLSNLVSGSGPSGTPSSPSTSTKSPSASTPSGTPAGQAHQSNEQRQAAKSPVLPRIPSIGLPNIPAAAESIATAVSSATASQLPAASTAPTSPGSSLPASTGVTPGVSGAPPVTPVAPGLAPIGGGLPTPPVTQAAPVSQGSPATPTPGVQAPSAPQSPAPAAPRGLVADLAWIQKSYGLSPSLELPKPESSVVPALFIASLPESETHLHRVLASLRHAFEQAGWSQPMAVATIRRGFEHRTVYATADALSIHPAGILLPSGVLPLDEMPSGPSAPELHGSLMVSEKLVSMIPREWTIEGVLSTVSGGEANQSIEEYQQLVASGELLVGKVSRGRDDVEANEALRVFARVAIGSAGCGELDAESARLRAARWVGTQPQGYLDSLARFYLSDAAESMSQGSWGEAVYSSEKYMSIRQSKAQVA